MHAPYNSVAIDLNIETHFFHVILNLRISKIGEKKIFLVWPFNSTEY